MSGLELLEKYPRAASVIRNYILNKMVEALQNESIDEEFKQYMREQGIDNDKIAPMIDANPRMLFDVFDEHNVIIETLLYPSKEFKVIISRQSTTNFWKTRKEAELFAIEAAFEILEEQLTPKEETNENV